MKKFLCIMLLLATTSAYAAPNLLGSANASKLYTRGIYFGLLAGRTALHNQYAYAQTLGGALAEALLGGIDRLGLGAYLGFRFNDYLSAEAGYIQLAYMDETGGLANVKNHTRVYSGHVLLKGSWPLCRYLSPFLKGGVAYVYQDIVSSQDYGATIIYKSKTGEAMPIAAAGFDIYITPSLAITASWTHYFKNGPIHDIDFPSVGASYTFG